MNEDYVSTFKKGLRNVRIPSILFDGVEVLRVKDNGSLQKAYLTLSSDRFTLYITAVKRGSSNIAEHGAALSAFFGLRRKAQTNTISSSNASIVSSSTSQNELEEGSIDVSSIDRIQRGQVTHLFELAKKARQESRSTMMADTEMLIEHCFSIIYRGSKTLDFVIPMEDRGTILDALDSVILGYQEAKVAVAKDVLLLRYVWLDVDMERTNKLNCYELGIVLERINYRTKKADLVKMYEKFAKILCMDRAQRRKGLTFEQCATFLHKVKRDSWIVKPVNVIWDDLFGENMNNGKPRMTVSTQSFLKMFLHGKQGEGHRTLTDVERIFASLHEMEMPYRAPLEIDYSRIDKNHFEAYLLSRHNDAFDPERENFDPNLMMKPIAEYWINSSHNTYLTGDQFTSHSSVQMYMDALYRGCRCLELDIWDGETDSSARPVPVVWHGHTMTSKILFVDILHCFKVFLNLHPQTYPIVLSFENHCSLPYQDVMAEDLQRVLGDKLYIPTENSLFERLPSPEALRGLIVIKGRRPDGSLDDFESDDESEDDELASNNESNAGTEKTTRTNATNSSSQTARSKNIKIKISPSLARLTLFHGCKHKSWDISVRNPTHHMHSFSENKVKKLCRQNRGKKWAIYNQSHMSRTYPAGSRVDSSNYNPTLAWSTGCQMVALNFQTPDPPLKINDGRFRENGNCGYVRKPEAILPRENLLQNSKCLKLSVRVLSGSCLPKPKGHSSGDCIDPYVKVTVHDVKNEEKDISSSYTTSIVQKNGYFPIWHNATNKDRFVFLIENYAVSIIQFEVFTKGDIGQADEFIAHAAIPISCLRQGYRSVQLFDECHTRSGPFDFACLLVEIKIRQVTEP